MRKIFWILFLASFVFAQDYGFFSLRLPPHIDCGQNFYECLIFFFYRILGVISVLAMALSAIFIAWAGILYIVKGGVKDEDTKKIRQRLIWAVVGLVVAFLSYAFVRALEFWMARLEVFLYNLTLAQSLPEFQPQESLECNGVNLPSVLQRRDVSPEIWKNCILSYIGRFLSFLYVLALMLGIIFLAWAGIMYITQPEKIKDVHKRLLYGVLGLIFAIFSFAIVRMIELFFKPQI